MEFKEMLDSISKLSDIEREMEKLYSKALMIEQREFLFKLVEKMKFTQMDVAKNTGLSFLTYTPTQIYNKALDDFIKKAREQLKQIEI